VLDGSVARASTRLKSVASATLAKASDGVGRRPGIDVRLARASPGMQEGRVRSREQPRRVTIRLTPYEARLLWRLRIAGLPEGARPRTATTVLVHALLHEAAALTEPEPAVAPAPAEPARGE
jgi:hypothetical protein